MFFLLWSIACESTNKNSQDNFCYEDYCRIPLVESADLIRLNGDTIWAFSPARAKIDSPVLSAFMNVKRVGINCKNNSFILITEDVIVNKVLHIKSALAITQINGLKEIHPIYESAAIDSIYANNQSTYDWYEVGDVWEEIIKTGKIPWCNQKEN